MDWRYKINWRLWLTVGLAITGAAELLRSFFALFDPITLDYSEMIVAGMARQLARTNSLAVIYAPPGTPYLLPGVQYPPLFIWFNALLLNLTQMPPLLTARILAWCGYAGSGILVGLLVWQETRQKQVALLTAFVPFCFWSVIIFIGAARPDPLALFFSLLTAFFYRRLGKSKEKTLEESLATRKSKDYGFLQILLVALLAALAFFSKQTYLAIGAAIFFDLLLTRGRRRFALFFGFTLAMLMGGGIWLINWGSDNTFIGIFDPTRAARFIFDKVPGFVGFFVLDHLPLLLIAAIAISWQLKQGEKFWPLYTLFAALACATIVKDGAVDYYFNELAYVLSIQVGLALSSRWTQADSNLVAKKFLAKQNLGITIAVGVQMLIAGGMFVGWGQGRDFDNFRPAYSQGLALVQKAQVQNRPALVFADNLLLATNRTDLIGDYFIYSILVENKKRDPQPLVNDLEHGYYDFVISEEFFRWPQVFQTILDSHYTLQYLDGKDGRHLFRLYIRKPVALFALRN